MNTLQINCPICKNQIFINDEFDEYTCPFCGENFIKDSIIKNDNTDSLSLTQNRTLRPPEFFDEKFVSHEIIISYVDFETADNSENKDQQTDSSDKLRYTKLSELNETLRQLISKTSLPSFENKCPGDIVYLGNYILGKNGESAPIKWRILKINEDKALLLCENIIDFNYFNEEKSNSWQSCILHKWLNFDFYNNAFNTAERKAIIATTLPDVNSIDKIFLLSLNDFRTYFTSKEDKICKVSPYLVKKYPYLANIDYNMWWLRSAGSNSKKAFTAGISFLSESVTELHGVRPALWIKFQQ